MHAPSIHRHAVLPRGVVLAAGLALAGSEAAAVPVRVDLEWPSGRPTPTLARARVLALRTAGPTGAGTPVEAEPGADGLELDLAAGVWQVQASAPGYWSPGVEVVVDRAAPPSVRLAFWPAASLHGEVRAAGGDPLPRDIAVRLTGGLGSDPSLPRADLRCRINEGAWSCPGPAGRFDVRLEAAGYAPRYEWGVTLGAATSTGLGPTVLRRAASVFGRAVRRDGSHPAGPCRATLRASDVTRRGSVEADPDGGPEADTNLSASVGRHGYFQILGMPPGSYFLAVECPAASGVRELHVEADRETRIDPPLSLEELTLDVVVTPRADLEGRPWQLAVDATLPRERRIERKATVSADGRWTRHGLTAGTYRVAVKSSDGTQWLQQFFELSEDSRPLLLRLPFVAVAGQVLLGTRPLRARLVFSSEAGGEPVTLASDEDGRFQGWLLGARDALESRWTVEVNAAQPSIRRRLEGVSLPSAGGEASAWLELSLPAVGVRGTVVAPGGEPQSGAEVIFEGDGGTRRVETTDDAGGFELAELPAGKYTAVAASVAGVSEPTALDVVEGVESELQLVLKGSERIAFQVVSGRGPVADAAVQVWIPPGIPRSFTRTDADGRFEVDLPPATTEVGLTVQAPGHALKLARLPVSDEQTIPLGAASGRLVLDLQRPGRTVDGSATPYLVHDGAIEAAVAIIGDSNGRVGPSVVEAVEPGVYALCLVAPEEVTSLWRGTLPRDRCRSVKVEAGATANLSLP
jgi:hypothetical protein